MKGFNVYDMKSVQLVPKGGGGGRPTSELVSTCLSLNVDEGIRIPEKMYNEGKGVASVYNAGRRHGIKFRVRRDVKGNIWLFRMRTNWVESRKAA